MRNDIETFKSSFVMCVRTSRFVHAAIKKLLGDKLKGNFFPLINDLSSSCLFTSNFPVTLAGSWTKYSRLNYFQKGFLLELWFSKRKVKTRISRFSSDSFGKNKVFWVLSRLLSLVFHRKTFDCFKDFISTQASSFIELTWRFHDKCLFHQRQGHGSF